MAIHIYIYIYSIYILPIDLCIDIMVLYGSPLVNSHITNWKDPAFSMGKSTQVSLDVSMPAVAWRRWSAELLKLGERGERGEALLEKWRSKPGETMEKGGFHGS